MGRDNDRKSFERMLGAKTQKAPPSKLVVTGYKSNFQGWRTFGGKRHYFRSRWEVQYCAYLEFLKNSRLITDWFYEPQVFEFPRDAYKTDPFSYLPDFKVVEPSGAHSWHEVKGYMTGKDRNKHRRFAKHYPNETLHVIMGDQIKQIAKHSRMIPGWEYFNSQPHPPVKSQNRA